MPRALAPGAPGLRRLLRTRRNVFLLGLGLLLLFGAIEEISWGQRVFGFGTPEWLLPHNMQSEVNIHNLAPVHGDIPRTGLRRWLTIEKLFALFWLSYCFLLPLTMRFSSSLAALARRINLPLVPLWLGALFPLNYVIAKVHENYVLPAELLGPLSEVKETTFEAIFLILAVRFWRTHEWGPADPSGASPRAG